MSSCRFLLLGLPLLLLLLSADSNAQYFGEMTPVPDYDTDYNATFEYSFFSNTSSEDLDRFSQKFIDEEEYDDTTTTGATTGDTETGAAALPVSLDIRILVWTLMVLTALNPQHL
ncbi:uncharacterized protein KZ484_007921 [Pholidichthys leucotaenia]